LDWDLEDRQPADWDDGARPYLENFLTLHMPYAAELPTDREGSEEEVRRSLSGRPKATKADFQRLLETLQHAGYGWLRPEGVKRKLQEMAANWTGPPRSGA